MDLHIILNVLIALLAWGVIRFLIGVVLGVVVGILEWVGRY